MKLIRLRLENFRQHRDTTVEFRDGMTAIVGENGSGKSTLLEAITFALFGEQRHTKDSVRFHWAGPKERFRSELTFEFGDRRYVVERGERGAQLRADGTLIAEGLREVKSECERLLHLTHDQFVNSFCAEQKSLEFLKFKDRSTRQNEVARMLGLDRLKSASELARQHVKVCRNKVQFLGEEHHGGEGLEAAAKEGAQRTREERARHADLAARVPVLERAAAEATVRRQAATRWLKLDEEAQKIDNESLRARVRLETLEEESARLDKDARERASIADQEREFQESTVRLGTMDAAARAHREAAAEHALRAKRSEEVEVDRRRLSEAKATDLEAIDRGPLDTRQRVESLEKDLRERQDRWHAANRERAEAHARAQAERDAARTALLQSERMTVGSPCPECGQLITKEYADLVARRGRELEAAEALLAEEESRLKQAGKTPPEWARLEAELEAAREAVTAAEARALELRAAWKRVQAFEAEQGPETSAPPYDAAAHAALQERVRELLPAHERAVQLQDVDERLAATRRKADVLKEQLANAAAAVAALRAEQEPLGIGSPEEAEAALEAGRSVDLEQAKLQAGLDASARVLEAAERESEAVAKRLAEYRERESRIAALKEDQMHTEAVVREMLALREQLNQQIRPDLEARASDNLQALSGGRYAALVLDEQFEATVLDDGVQKAVISGGEEDIVALSLRLALSELIQERQGTPLSLLILDEVFGSLDGERRQLVMERLAGLKGRFDQVLVISHIEEINQVADQCVYLHRDESSKSTYASDAPLAEPPVLLL